jgi:hypothetical protein
MATVWPLRPAHGTAAAPRDAYECSTGVLRIAQLNINQGVSSADFGRTDQGAFHFGKALGQYCSGRDLHILCVQETSMTKGRAPHALRGLDCHDYTSRWQQTSLASDRGQGVAIIFHKRFNTNLVAELPRWSPDGRQIYMLFTFPDGKVWCIGSIHSHLAPHLPINKLPVQKSIRFVVQKILTLVCTELDRRYYHERNNAFLTKKRVKVPIRKGAGPRGGIGNSSEAQRVDAGRRLFDWMKQRGNAHPQIVYRHLRVGHLGGTDWGMPQPLDDYAQSAGSGKYPADQFEFLQHRCECFPWSKTSQLSDSDSDTDSEDSDPVEDTSQGVVFKLKYFGMSVSTARQRHIRRNLTLSSCDLKG